MVTAEEVEKQLKRIGCNYTVWGSTEVAELPEILMDGEQIVQAVNGYYEGGFGLLVATNFRVLIVDKKPFTMNVEDLRYDMITEVNYGARIITSTMHISLPTRTMYFSSWSMDRLHKAMRHVQQHVTDARNGGSPLADDWFARQLTLQTRTAHAASRITKLARSALLGHSQASVESPQMGYSSSQHAINPYNKLPSLERRRRYPVVNS
jgi:Bacterial PH domain